MLVFICFYKHYILLLMMIFVFLQLDIYNGYIFLNQTVLSAVYAYLIWSFAASFFAYTSYLAMFFLSYFLFRMLQKETAPC